MSSKWGVALLALTLGDAGAVERPQPPLETRVRDANLVAVVDAVERLPATAKEFDKFYRVRVRVAGVLKGDARIGDHIEVVVNGTISEQRNDCCVPGRTYVMFLAPKDGRFYFVGSPLGAVPVDLHGSH
ncbi:MULTISPECIES: hypothetical protein [Pseudoxanthomonas]|jgi:hypothetical protein|uniref:Uncharacterized protein n=1 Tax=Pseudoxanthomonas winnipegensis TaxID=2480810 RepID=A0A4Q8L9G0_9GAMM|nr:MULTISPECIES: hypothetical protein [Pseudoxanthomonas]PZP58822.1 MAG: hypothetical protein DI597_17550 [Pseudoxanthomonas spadix]TAA24546.1 hypothetical protein EA660_12545 [Pseudoxanthomonas winnipegensis]TMN18408.1 hypothetical protein FF950_14845 [Pseudoxanthomonas sp. X-1]UAY76081.1 hypothetical protein LAJ50_07565 [Pseudoxanthomonas sp. X-1]